MQSKPQGSSGSSSDNLGILYPLWHQFIEFGSKIAERIAQLSNYDVLDNHPKARQIKPLTMPPKVEPVTVVFVDLRDFTSLVEDYAPAQVVQQLNEYFAEMTRIILNNGGVLDKYMGDEIMAYFESETPMEFARSAYNAVNCAVEMIQALDKLNQQWRKRNWPELQCGIGINSGPVLKGHIGSKVNPQITIIGDTVNVASRLQALNKQYNTQLLISGHTYKLIQGDFPLRALGDVQIRGRRKTAHVYEVDLNMMLNPTP